MKSIFLKEINSFFSSLIGYIVIGVFLVLMGAFMWIFPDYSILQFGYATLNQLFEMAPWIFCFLIPAITMRSFAEEMQSGTIELLATRPITDLQIILGKFFANWLLVVFALVPTLIYYYTVSILGAPPGNIDGGEVAGSYIGLILLAGAFVSIGLFASSITGNQIEAFVMGIFLCFFFYMVFDLLSGLFIGSGDHIIELFGINYHYNLLSRGAIDSRDLIYFLTFITGFIMLTKTSLSRRSW